MKTAPPTKTGHPVSETAEGTLVASSPAPLLNDDEYISRGISLMTDFAVRRGINFSLPATTGNASPADTMARYNALVSAIKPATVQSIRFIESQVIDSDGTKMRWYRIPIFTKCLAIAGVALLVLIGISLSPVVNEANLSKGLLASSGIVLLTNLVFVCSASLLGVMFYLLKTVSDKIKNYSLLPIDAIEVNTTILIGMISGFIISELLSIQEGALGGSIELHKMTLALLGGFSSDAIFTILQGIVNKAKNFLAPAA